MSNHDERLRILRMIESKQISAEEGSRLLEALEADPVRARTPSAARSRSLRVQVTDLATRRQKISVTIPVSLVGIGLKLGARLFPRTTNSVADDVRRAVETGDLGRVFDIQDLEENERIEIFIEM
ncbi:MAG: hypothetical protein SH847_18325 [Roseiflexaceae bacterium]|nr:hypothetical protein [Roseiflexaceae bacterium]